MDQVRAAIYCRISDDREGAGLGVARQQADCERVAAAEGWHVAVVHVDNDLSAYSGRPRPAYAQLLDDIRGGRIDAVIAWHPDRLHRAPVELEEFIAVVEQTGVQVRTATAGAVDLSTASGRMTARVVGAVARHESEHKAERARAKAAQLAESGRSNGGPRTFGYEPDHHTIREDEAALVREAARRALAGESLTSIARDWNDRAIPTVRGAQGWTYQAMRRMITSPRHAGLRAHRGEVVGEAVWPGIIDRDTFDQLRVRLRPGRAPATRVRKRLLTGLACCGRCGHRLYSKVNNDSRPVYRCVTDPGRGQGSACGGLSVIADGLDGTVAALVLDALAGPGLGQVMAGSDDADTAAMAEQLATLEGRLEELAGDFADGTIGRAEWRVARERIAGRMDQVRGQLTARRDVSVLAQLPAGAGPLAAWWEAAPVTARRAVVDATVERIDVAPKGHRGGKTFDPARAQVTWRL